jgi:peptidoglycan hydrolase CwlO-like protein
MSISIELLATVISVIILIIGFILSRNKEAESRGRLMQRIDNLEKQLADMTDRHRSYDDKISCHDTDIVKITSDIESLRDLIERIDKKLDKVLERTHGEI